MSVTTCCSAKGGSGTSVVAALLALRPRRPSLLIDAVGDMPAVLGLAPPGGQGLSDWFESDAPPDAVAELAHTVDATTRLVARGPTTIDPMSPRWPELADWLGASNGFDVVVDAGLGPPPAALLAPGEGRRTVLVTRPCYVSLARAVAAPWRPDGVVLVNERWRSLGADDVERALGVPVVARIEHDPAIARAVDAGLAVARLPRTAHNLRIAAA
jgi:hypothetical protein